MLPVDTIAVTVTRASTTLFKVSSAVSVVSRERIQAGRVGLTLDEALNDVPGVLVNNRYNFALGTRISVRGLGARAAFGVRGVRLLADGIPLTMPDGQAALNNIDLSSTGRIEVLRGAASMLYGNAAGGVVSLSTETPAAGFAMEARGIAADLGRGGFGDLARFNIKAGGGSERVRYLVNGTHTRGNGARDHSSFEQSNVTARLEHFATSNARTAFTLSIADAPTAENPGSLPRDSVDRNPAMAWPRNVATFAGEKSRQLQAGIRHQRTVGNNDADIAVYGLTRTLDNPLPFAYITLNREAAGIRATLGNERLSFGVDVETQRDERGEFVNNGGAPGAQRRDQTDRVFTVGPFVRAFVPLARRVDLTAGVRYDRARFEVEDRFTSDGRDDSGSRTLTAFSPMLGLTYRLTAERTLFANVSTSFQTPTTTEMINRPPATDEPCCPAGFNDLDPERAVSSEAGFRGRLASRIHLDAAAYHMRVRAAIMPYQVAQIEGRDFFRNSGRTRHTGFELATTAVLTTKLSATTSYTYSHFTFEDTGKRLPGVPPHHALIRASLKTRYVVIEPEAELTASYYANDANTEVARNPSATVLNLRMRGRTALGFDPFIIVSNLTGERYNSSVVINAAGSRFFEPAPGRSLFLGLSATKVFR